MRRGKEDGQDRERKKGGLNYQPRQAFRGKPRKNLTR